MKRKHKFSGHAALSGAAAATLIAGRPRRGRVGPRSALGPVGSRRVAAGRDRNHQHVGRRGRESSDPRRSAGGLPLRQRRIQRRAAGYPGHAAAPSRRPSVRSTDQRPRRSRAVRRRHPRDLLGDRPSRSRIHAAVRSADDGACAGAESGCSRGRGALDGTVRRRGTSRSADGPAAGGGAARRAACRRGSFAGRRTRGNARAEPAEHAEHGPSAPPAGSGADEYRVRPGDSLSRIATKTQRPGVSLDQMLVALFRTNPQAFISNNMNRLKSGAVLAVPTADAAQAITPPQAREVITAQSADFGAYRQRLAGNTMPATPEGSARQSSGKVQAAVEDRKQAAAPTPDRLTLSKGTGTAAPSAEEERLIKEREKKAAEARVAELSKNVEQLEKLSKSGRRSRRRDAGRGGAECRAVSGGADASRSRRTSDLSGCARARRCPGASPPLHPHRRWRFRCRRPHRARHPLPAHRWSLRLHRRSPRSRLPAPLLPPSPRRPPSLLRPSATSSVR